MPDCTEMHGPQNIKSREITFSLEVHPISTRLPDHEYILFIGMDASELNTLRTGDTDLRFYITTVQDG